MVEEEEEGEEEEEEENAGEKGNVAGVKEKSGERKQGDAAVEPKGVVGKDDSSTSSARLRLWLCFVVLPSMKYQVYSSV